MTEEERRAWRERIVWMHQHKPEWAQWVVINSIDWLPGLAASLGLPLFSVKHTTVRVPRGEVWWGRWKSEADFRYEPYTPFAACVQLEIPKEV